MTKYEPQHVEKKRCTEIAFQMTPKKKKDTEGAHAYSLYSSYDDLLF